MELSNGCICCSINDGLVDAAYRVLERDDGVDYMVIETTGVADPLPIALTFLGTELRYLTSLDSIITVVDAEAFNREHFHSEAALKQITYGDIILLNKTDLATPDKLADLETFIKETKANAKILHTTYGQVALPLIIDVDLVKKDEYAPFMEEDEHHYQHHEHEHDHEDEHHHHHHNEHEHHHHHSHHLENDGFVSISYESDQPFDVYKFEHFLNEQMPDNVFRAKGILWFSDSELRHIFQLSGPRYHIDGEEWSTTPKNQLVFIGRNLKKNEVHSLLDQCLVL
ncbi:MAG: GTP-binding protein, partial [Richelia sp.]|nr:GTP-binding protein [Richelia sp.]